jgi:D-ribose pyranose/furanose isomerase RbsD
MQMHRVMIDMQFTGTVAGINSSMSTLEEHIRILKILASSGINDSNIHSILSSMRQLQQQVNYLVAELESASLLQQTIAICEARG